VPLVEDSGIEPLTS